jgi:2-polyprenyl-6-methoxyphenol hydroxylase-like FAD-dependent oxidoreductase
VKIIVDRVRRWHAPGVLFLGDAAHTMSPAGGQGLNLAIRDTFVAANYIVDAIKEGRSLDDALFQKIQDERQPEIDAMQAGQTRAGQMVLKPLPVLRVMLTILGLAMRLAGRRLQMAQGVPKVDPRYLTAVNVARK